MQVSLAKKPKVGKSTGELAVISCQALSSVSDDFPYQVFLTAQASSVSELEKTGVFSTLGVAPEIGVLMSFKYPPPHAQHMFAAVKSPSSYNPHELGLVSYHEQLYGDAYASVVAPVESSFVQLWIL